MGIHMSVGWFNCSNLPHDVQAVQVMLDRLIMYMPSGTFTLAKKAPCPPPATDGYYDAKFKQAIKSF